jgi:hypothetical protein
MSMAEPTPPPSGWRHVLFDRDWPESVPKSEESEAHRLLNGLVILWTLGYLAVVIFPIMSSNGQGAIGAGVGFAAASVLFIPWLVVLLILVVLRSTTRSR